MSLEKIDFSVAICALARDCASALTENILRIEQLREMFRSSAVVVVENDSKDSTKGLLNQWAQQSENVTIISHDFDTVTIPSATSANLYPATSIHRIEKMAAYRNIYLDWIEQEQHNKKFNLVIMIDIDVEYFSVKSIIKSIKNAPNNWGGLFAYGYTDSKVGNLHFYKIFHDLYAFLDEKPFSKPYLTYARMFSSSKLINRKIEKSKYIPIWSAFGGIGIYKLESILGLQYEPILNEDTLMEAVCEHIPFNLDVIKRGYQNYISTEMKVYYGISDNIMVLRNILPLSIFKFLAFVFTLKKLKA